MRKNNKGKTCSAISSFSPAAAGGRRPLATATAPPEVVDDRTGSCVSLAGSARESESIPRAGISAGWRENLVVWKPSSVQNWVEKPENSLLIWRWDGKRRNEGITGAAIKEGGWRDDELFRAEYASRRIQMVLNDIEMRNTCMGSGVI